MEKKSNLKHPVSSSSLAENDYQDRGWPGCFKLIGRQNKLYITTNEGRTASLNAQTLNQIDYSCRGQHQVPLMSAKNMKLSLPFTQILTKPQL